MTSAGRRSVPFVLASALVSVPSWLSAASPELPATGGAAGLPNFAKVADGIWRGGRPNDEGLLHLRRLGIRTIINREQWTSDRGRVRGTGLKCVELPCNAMSRPRDEDMIAILTVLCGAAKEPVFVHCLYGADRTGCVVALFRIVVEGWSVDQAESEMRSFGFNPACRRIEEYLEEFRRPQRVEQMRRRLPEPARAALAQIPSRRNG